MATGKLKPRTIVKEDLHLATVPNPTQVTKTIMGAGDLLVTPIDAVLYSAFGSYANDGAAAAGGVLVGQLYWNTTNNKLHTRMS